MQTKLGTRQYCRDNVTMFPGNKVGCYYNITIFGVATPSKQRYLDIFRILLDPEVLLRCRFNEAIKLSRAQLCMRTQTFHWCATPSI